MSNTRRLIAAMALALLALPAAAESAPERFPSDAFVLVGGDVGWELAQQRHFDATSPRPAPHAAAPVAPALDAAPGDFEFTGGEAGWQLVPQAYAWRDGRLVRSDPIVAEPRPASKLTTGDLEEMARLYMGG